MQTDRHKATAWALSVT